MAIDNTESFAGILRSHLESSTQDLSGGTYEALAGNEEHWVKSAEVLGKVATALYGEDLKARRAFLNNILGIRP